MITGYVLGCLLSMLVWNLDRHAFFKKLNKIMSLIKNILVRELLNLTIFIVIFTILFKYQPITYISCEIYNFITAFLVIDISNIEKKSVFIKGKTNFNDSISKISQAICSGFIAPLLYIIILGNSLAIFYMLIYMCSKNEEYILADGFKAIMDIVPSIIAEIFLYIFFILKNKSFQLDFRGSFFHNMIFNPILNIDIIAANLEKISFYYCETKENKSVVMYYGKFNNNINIRSLKNYFSVIYSICFMAFAFFILHFL